MSEDYAPTKEQEVVIGHNGPAFVTACPGAGKTRTMVERARLLLSDGRDRRGVAFLSFTNAAVDELEVRLRSFGILPTPLFPSFIGTFDRFLWQFFVAPFGMEGCDVAPRLIPDKGDWVVQPYEKMQELPLKAFDRKTGRLNRAIAAEEGFDADRDATKHEALALKMLASARSKGHVDFEDVRTCVKGRLADKAFAERLGKALAARFKEIFVDEAQDCNPDDLEVVQWLRTSGLIVKVICDPNQSIYQFRGGITDELDRFADRFEDGDRLPMSGNFRSTPAICAAIVGLRPPSAHGVPDRALGSHKADSTAMHILSYGGTSVPAAIGVKFGELVKAHGIAVADAPILASRLQSAARAIGHPVSKDTVHKTLLLARAATDFHFSFSLGNRREALSNLHRAILLVQGRIETAGDYHRHVLSEGLEDGRWRPEIIDAAATLKFSPGMSADAWLDKARCALAPGLATPGGIRQRLKSSNELLAALATPPADAHPARTIHSTKGLEFPAVCVVLTSNKAGGILDHLEGAARPEFAEDARKIYVAASRAERLLVMAIPKSRAKRLETLLQGNGCSTARHDI
ncbi:UvrD-helicase domain-containing protein [Novosphingobium sp. CECT 9465]|uniref:UvrD-helicase domain-containing protein n=1 Tax=Novosphingobium sp. CECT 9465 TaxID=2829794 RepID=UPI001E414A83|nr:ATP-dependent helicase [Novosphingobium sp. CECT 9465]CAH0497824.1 ATP-dependent DNA helicase Rep [Novosphingobium sp. CECT 9465]